MSKLYIRFLRGVSANFISTLGAAMVTSVVLLFVLFEILHTSGVISQAYIGLITYLAFPALFILGLLFIPIGWFIWSKQNGKPISELLSAKFAEDLKPKQLGAKLWRTVAALTLLNLVIFGAATSRMLHFMDSAHFCGTACHSVMNPEWVTYQQSPHARVACVECHVGEGVGALIDSKINGTWQMISVTFDLLDRPIPTPVHNLRPARETCEKCHWPDLFLGNRIKTFPHYSADSLSTAQYTTLMLKVGSGARQLDKGSHWHVGAHNQVRYASLEDKREDIVWVEVLREGQAPVRYESARLADRANEVGDAVRVMDCVDCHNRATHIYEPPERAVDSRIAKYPELRGLPFAKRVMLEAVLKNMPSDESRREYVRTSMESYYSRGDYNLSLAQQTQLDQAVDVANSIVERNIHPEMNITWGSYPSKLGHRENVGCFRCHNMDMKASDGQGISMDCTLCHSILALESEKPFQFLSPSANDSSNIEHPLEQYYKQEFESN